MIADRETVDENREESEDSMQTFLFVTLVAIAILFTAESSKGDSVVRKSAKFFGGIVVLLTAGLYWYFW